MKQIIAKKDFKVNDKNYLQGEIVEVDNIEQVLKLNALGFIEPLKHKDLVLIERELEKKEVKDEL